MLVSQRFNGQLKSLQKKQQQNESGTMSYKKTEKKSISKLIASLHSEDSIDFDQAKFALNASRVDIDKKIGADIDMTLMSHMSSLSASDIETKTWANLDTSDPKVREFARVVRAWTPEEPMGLFIYGIPGNAKTHMMKSLILHHCSPSYRFLFLPVCDFFSECKNYVRTDFHCNNFLNHLVETYNAVVLDDLGTEKSTDFEQSSLFALMEQMKERDRRVFMTSNLTIGELKKRYEDRIVSRIGEFMIAIENQCDSYRKKIHQQNLEMYREKVRLIPRNK